MLLRPIKNNSRKGRTSTLKRVPAPSGGLNSLDDLTTLSANEAIELINCLPTEDGSTLRDGYSLHASGMGAPVEMLMRFSKSDGVDELFASTADSIFNVTGQAAVGSAEITGLSNGKWQWVNYANAAGTFLVICNGSDDVRYYNGTSWEAPIITGVASTDLVNVTSHMSRLWFIEKESLNVWYLEPNAVAGNATKLDLGPFSKEGGYLVAMGSWTRDGGEGLDDVAVFVTSEGEVHVYSGTDPNSTATWGRAGTYKIAPPIGHGCMKSFGADLGILTTQGLVPLSAIQGLAVSAQQNASATNRIRGHINKYFASNGNDDGWQFIESEEHGLLIINVPVVSGSKYEQFVMNTRTGGRWGHFKDINTKCWERANEALYFGGLDGSIWRYGADNDDGEAIEAKIIHAFSDFGTPYEKGFKQYRPQFSGPPGYKPLVGIRVNYDDADIVQSIAPPSPVGAEWDVAEWDAADWAPDKVVSKKWYGIKGEGHVGAVIVKFSAVENVRYDGGLIRFENLNDS